MRTRRNSSLAVALLLAVIAVAPLAVESRVADSSVRPAAVAAAEGGRLDAKPKGNGFVRAITAPFRALGRLFGGGRKKDDSARRRKAGGEQQTARATQPRTDAAQADAPTEAARPDAPNRPVTPAPVEAAANVATTAAGTASAPTAAVTEGADVVASAAAAVVAPAQGAASVLAPQGARVVRPATGGELAIEPPKWVPVIEGIAKDPLTQGRALLEHGYPNEAVSELSVAAVVGPDLAEANKLLGVALDRLGQHKQAIEAYERALTVEPDNAEVLNNYGYSLFLAGRPAEALVRLKKAERLTPGATYVLANVAVVQAKLGKYGDAFKSFTRAYGEYEARIKTAELLEEAGRTGDALKHYESARKLQPDSPALLERLASLYERKGRTREAEAARRAIGNPPNKQKTATGGGG